MNTKKLNSKSVQVITSELAIILIAECVKKAEEMGKPVSIAVCDGEGNQKALLRMDGASMLTAGVASDKASTAAAFGISTDALYEYIKNDPPLANGLLHVTRLIAFGGGYPVKESGGVIGGLGVSGAHYSEDMAIAKHALSVVGLTC